MFLNKIINNQTKLIEFQLINKGLNFSIQEVELSQHLATTTTNSGVLESIYFLDLLTNAKSMTNLQEKEHRNTILFNRVKLTNASFNFFLLITQLFLVPEIKKNAYKFIIKDTQDSLSLQRLNYKNLKSFPSCYYNWTGSITLKLVTPKKKTLKKFLTFLSFK